MYALRFMVRTMLYHTLRRERQDYVACHLHTGPSLLIGKRPPLSRF